MLKKIILLILVNMNLSLLAQITTTKEETKIEIVKAKLVDNVSFIGIRQLKVTSDDLQKVMIKTKIKSTIYNKTKLSAFSLLDIKNKIRYRLADYKGYTGFIGEPELIPFRKEILFNENGKEINGDWLPKYDNSERDYFNKYDKEGYRNFEMKINFGTTKKPILSIIYFGETSYEKFTAELYFAILVEYKDSDYELYYKDEKISSIKFE
jgi:transposase-like protein